MRVACGAFSWFSFEQAKGKDRDSCAAAQRVLMQKQVLSPVGRVPFLGCVAKATRKAKGALRELTWGSSSSFASRRRAVSRRGNRGASSATSSSFNPVSLTVPPINQSASIPTSSIHAPLNIPGATQTNQAGTEEGQKIKEEKPSFFPRTTHRRRCPRAKQTDARAPMSADVTGTGPGPPTKKMGSPGAKQGRLVSPTSPMGVCHDSVPLLRRYMG